MMDPLQVSQMQYSLRLDGVAQETAARMAADVRRAIDRVTAELARRVPEDAPVTFERLQAVRKELVALRSALEEQIGAAMTEAREAVLETAPASVEAAATRVSASFVSVPVETLALATSAPFKGKSWADWGKRLADNTMAAVEQELREAVLLGESIPKAAKRLQGVMDLQRKNAERLARTALNDWNSRAHLALYEANPSIIQEVEVSVVFDGRTSGVCQGLSGKRWRLDDPDLQRPPYHPNCRSVLLPITRSFESIIGERGREMDQRLEVSREKPAVMSSRPVKDIPAELRPQTIRRVSASLTYEDWLRNHTTEAFQREVLGPTRFSAFQKGIPLSGMATYSRPLPIEELKRLYPKEFSDA